MDLKFKTTYSINLTIECFLDLKSFKLFLRLMWEPFEEQFKSTEMNFSKNAEIVFRSVMIHSVHQNSLFKKETQERQG